MNRRPTARNSTLSSCLIGVYKLLKKHCDNEDIIPATIPFSNTIGRNFKNEYTLPCTRFKYGNFRSFRMISTKYWLAMPCYAFLCYTQNSTSCYASQHPNWSESKTHYVITQSCEVPIKIVIFMSYAMSLKAISGAIFSKGTETFWSRKQIHLTSKPVE